MAEIGFDWENAEDATFEPVPPGKYQVVCLSCQDKEKEPGKTSRNLELEIQDGQYKGRKIWDFLLVNHPSEAAQKISRGRFKQFVLATGIRPNDTDDLVGHTVTATVKVKTDQNGNLQNQVSSYSAVKGAAPAQAAPPQQAAPAQGNGKKPAWQK
jgi:hypothetical protein